MADSKVPGKLAFSKDCGEADFSLSIHAVKKVLQKEIKISVEVTNPEYLQRVVNIFFSKKLNFAICNCIDGLRRYFSKWNESDREIQMPNDFYYIWHLNKMKEKNRNRLIDS